MRPSSDDVPPIGLLTVSRASPTNDCVRCWELPTSDIRGHSGLFDALEYCDVSSRHKGRQRAAREALWLVEPDNGPEAVMILWPDQPTLVSPRHYGDLSHGSHDC